MLSTAFTHRAVAWTKDNPVGAEFAAVDLAADRMRARGVAIGSDPEPYRLDYELETGPGFITQRVVVRAAGQGWNRQLVLDRSDMSAWAAEVSQVGEAGLPDAGGNLDAVSSAVDPDLGLSPLFNTIPVLRHRLQDGGPAHDFLMVWISVPDLSIHASPQRYTFLEASPGEERLIRFQATGEGDDFVADVVFDRDGLVVDYPGIASRLRGAPLL